MPITLARTGAQGHACKMSLWPKGEGLRKALRWLAEQRAHSLAEVEEAARRFNLSPLEEEFLIRWLVKKKTARKNG